MLVNRPRENFGKKTSLILGRYVNNPAFGVREEILFSFLILIFGIDVWIFFQDKTGLKLAGVVLYI